MVSAPAAIRAATPRRRRSAETRRRSIRATPRRSGSAPAAVRTSPNPRARRAFSASPTTRPWAGRKPPKSVKSVKGASRLAMGLTTLLALQAAFKGRAPPPVIPEHHKQLAVWPLGSSGPYYPATKTYNYAKTYGVPALAWEFKGPNRKRISRKMFPGSVAPRQWYEPTELRRERVSRKVTAGRGPSVPIPVITGTDVRFLEQKGFVFPKAVHDQAQLGLPIVANKKVPNWIARPEYRESFAGVLAHAKPPVNRFSTKKQLALPSGVKSKLHALENRARAVAIEGAAKAATFPWRAAAKARAATGYMFSLPVRAYQAARQTVRKTRRSVSVSRRRAAHVGM